MKPGHVSCDTDKQAGTDGIEAIHEEYYVTKLRGWREQVIPRSLDSQQALMPQIQIIHVKVENPCCLIQRPR